MTKFFNLTFKTCRNFFEKPVKNPIFGPKMGFSAVFGHFDPPPIYIYRKFYYYLTYILLLFLTT